MNAIVMIFVCLLSDGSTLYQGLPCAEAPDWALSGRTVVGQRTVQSVIVQPPKEAKEEARAEIARGDAASERARADIQADLDRQRDLAIVRELGYWHWKALSDRKPDNFDVDVSVSQSQRGKRQPADIRK